MEIWGITGGRRGNDVLVEGVAHAFMADFPTDFSPIFAFFTLIYALLGGG